MSVTVQLPTPLQRYADEQEEVIVDAATVGDALKALAAAHTELGEHLFDANGKVRSYVAIYLGDDDTRYLEREATVVKDGDVITIVPSIAGGSCGRAFISQ